MQKYPKSHIAATKQDEALNKRAGWNTNDLKRYLEELLEFGTVEVGWRQSCGYTDPTMYTARGWQKVLKALRSEGAKISEERIKHDCYWATKCGGFWTSTRYTLNTNEQEN